MIFNGLTLFNIGGRKEETKGFAMKKYTLYLIAGILFTSLLSREVCATDVGQGRVPLDRDTTYEQNLKRENGADKTVTPAKVIRWMMNMRGQQAPAPSSTEFVPIVNAHDGHIRLVAALAYKF